MAALSDHSLLSSDANSIDGERAEESRQLLLLSADEASESEGALSEDSGDSRHEEFLLNGTPKQLEQSAAVVDEREESAERTEERENPANLLSDDHEEQSEDEDEPKAEDQSGNSDIVVNQTMNSSSASFDLGAIKRGLDISALTDRSSCPSCRKGRVPSTATRVRRVILDDSDFSVDNDDDDEPPCTCLNFDDAAEGSEDEDRDLSGFVVDDDEISYEQEDEEEEAVEEPSDCSLASDSTDASSDEDEGSIVDWEDDDGEEVEDDEEEDSPFLSTTRVTKATYTPAPKHNWPTEAVKRVVEIKKKEITGRNRVKLADELYALFNKEVFDGKLPPDMNIIWQKRLLKTAGRWEYDRIALSVKVLTGEGERLCSTLLHEMCHAAVSLIDQIRPERPHGPEFKRWAHLGMQKLHYQLKNVDGGHSYKIHYKFHYVCRACSLTYKRHSKSIDVAKSRCGRCRGEFDLFVDGVKLLQAAAQSPVQPTIVEQLELPDISAQLGGLALD